MLVYRKVNLFPGHCPFGRDSHTICLSFFRWKVSALERDTLQDTLGRVSKRRRESSRKAKREGGKCGHCGFRVAYETTRKFRFRMTRRYGIQYCIYLQYIVMYTICIPNRPKTLARWQWCHVKIQVSSAFTKLDTEQSLTTINETWNIIFRRISSQPKY